MAAKILINNTYLVGNVQTKLYVIKYSTQIVFTPRQYFVEFSRATNKIIRFYIFVQDFPFGQTLLLQWIIYT